MHLDMVFTIKLLLTNCSASADPAPVYRLTFMRYRYNPVFIDFKKPEREGGKSSYSFFTYFGMALESIATVSRKPIHIIAFARSDISHSLCCFIYCDACAFNSSRVICVLGPVDGFFDLPRSFANCFGTWYCWYLCLFIFRMDPLVTFSYRREKIKLE